MKLSKDLKIIAKRKSKRDSEKFNKPRKRHNKRNLFGNMKNLQKFCLTLNFLIPIIFSQLKRSKL
jgi:hypothetical protein